MCVTVCWVGENKSCPTMAVTASVTGRTGVATGQTHYNDKYTNTHTTKIQIQKHTCDKDTNTQTHMRQRYKYRNTHATTIQIHKHTCDKDTNKETHMRQGYKYTLQIHKYQTCVRHGVCGQHFWANILSIPFTKYMTRCVVHLTYQNHHYGISARYGVASKKC